MLKWLTNIEEDHPYRIKGDPQEEASRQWMLSHYMQGKPKATDKYTVDELREMHMIGLYEGLIDAR